MSNPLPQSPHSPLHATVAAIDVPHPDIRIIRLAPEQPFTFAAGQFVRIAFAGMAPRPYSIAIAPGGEIEIHIKRGSGEASLYALERLATGEKVIFSGPEGDSIYRGLPQEPVLALAGGLGIAPLKAISEHALGHAGHKAPFELIWATASAAEQYLPGHFEHMAKQYPNFSFTPLTGTLITDALAARDGSLAGWRVFISGPPAMTAALLPLLRDKGAAADKISFDRHPGPDTLKS